MTFPDGEEENGADDAPRHLSDADVEAAFRDIAAELGPGDLSPAAIQPGPEGTDHGGPRDYAVVEPDDAFVPPDPGPVTSSDPFLTAGWVLLAGGLLTIILSLILWPAAPRAFHLGCLAAAIGGGGLLTWRMPRHRRADDDDTGAVV